MTTFGRPVATGGGSVDLTALTARVTTLEADEKPDFTHFGSTSAALTNDDRGAWGDATANDIVFTIPEGLDVGTERHIGRTGANNVDAVVGNGLTETISLPGTPPDADGAVRLNEEGQILIKKTSATAWTVMPEEAGAGGGGATFYQNPTTSPPTNPSDGDFWAPSNAAGLRYRQGGAWVPA